MQTKLELVMVKAVVGEAWQALEAIEETTPLVKSAPLVYPSSKKTVDWNKIEKVG